MVYQYPYVIRPGDRYIQRFLATVYNRQIEAPQDVLPLIQWWGQPSDEACSEALYNLCILRLVRWMNGTGHPRKMMEQGLITSQLYDEDRGDRGLRARLLCLAATGSPLRLVGAGKEKVAVGDEAIFRVSG